MAWRALLLSDGNRFFLIESLLRNSIAKKENRNQNNDGREHVKNFVSDAIFQVGNYQYLQSKTANRADIGPSAYSGSQSTIDNSLDNDTNVLELLKSLHPTSAPWSSSNSRY